MLDKFSWQHTKKSEMKVTDYDWFECVIRLQFPNESFFKQFILFDRHVWPLCDFKGPHQLLIPPAKQYFPPKRFLTSWKDAAALCKSIGGYLPFFFSKEDLEEFIALLKLLSTFPPLEGVYLGININMEKVGNFGNEVN